MLVVVALGRRYAGRWFQVLGATSAVLVFVGVFSPLDLAGVDTANFFGYVLWSVWLVAFGVVVLVHERRARVVERRRLAADGTDATRSPRTRRQAHAASTTAPMTWQRALRWLPTFFGFPLGGLVAELVPARSTGSRARSSAEPSPA